MSLAANLLHWFRRSLLGLIAFAGVLALLGFAYQILGNLLDPQRFPQRGRSVQAGTLKLNIDCSGQGHPTVILDSGMGVPALGWARFSRRLQSLRAFVRTTGRAMVGAKSGRSPEQAFKSPRNLGRFWMPLVKRDPT